MSSRLTPFNRDIRSAPDESEPAHSYEEQSYMEQVAEEFHSKFSKREVQNSFWRTPSETERSIFSTIHVGSPEIGNRPTSGLLRNATVTSSEASDSHRSPKSMSRKESMNSTSSATSATREAKKKENALQRAAERRRKLDFQGTEQDEEPIALPYFEPPLPSSLDRSSSDQSTGSLLYGKAPSTQHISKGSSLIFPTGVDEAANNMEDEKRRIINFRLDQCEAVRFRFKKKLMLNKLNLTAADIPLPYLCGTSLGNSLHKLSLAGNHVGTIPDQLVVSLPSLKHLDLSQCDIHRLPDKWSLPQLKRLNLRHNLLVDFPEEGMLKGLPELQELDLYGNKVAEIIVPRGEILSKLEVLDLGYNDLAYLPDELDQLRSLKTLKVMNNYLGKIPMRICEMDLRVIDVSSNPVTQPPIETCERGIASMKRYYHCLKREEQHKKEVIESERSMKGKPGKKKAYGLFTKSLGSRPKSFSSPAKEDSEYPGHPNTAGESLRSESEPTMRHASAAPKLDEIPAPSYAVKSQSDSVVPRKIDTSTQNLSLMSDAFDKVVVNDTLKVIFVGMEMVGKTSMIKRLIEGNAAVVPTRDERTIGVDIYEWDPKRDKRFEHIDTKIEIFDNELKEACGDVDVKLSVWDFAGQHVYHATHELFFSQRALYVLVWDMGATNRKTLKRTNSITDEQNGTFALHIDDSDDEEDNTDLAMLEEEEQRRADRELEIDIDEKVQFWIDCIQSSAPGAAILPVASFADYFKKGGGDQEAIRRCNILKRRLLRHEERRLQGIKDRLKEYYDNNRADDPAAARLRRLLCSFQRPKLIFGDAKDSVIRVSGTEYTGFADLTEKIIGVATGRDKGPWRYPVFHGHVGARIPRMRLQVREAVRSMRNKFMVVEWGHFLNNLKDQGLDNTDDISDALHFLSKIGELSYFGRHDVINTEKEGTPTNVVPEGDSNRSDRTNEDGSLDSDAEDEDFDEDNAMLSMDDTSITAPNTEDGSLTTVEDFMSTGLTQFIFLNPRWLVAAVACILRHDLDREIRETRRLAASGRGFLPQRSFSFEEAQLNCPVITADDACMLWQTKRITKLAAKRAQEYSNNMSVTPFEFLQLLLIRFGVFVPIDLSIDKTFLGGKDYTNALSHIVRDEDVHSSDEENAKFFFLPSLLGPGEPSEAWTYKTTDAWKTTLCHSLLFPDGVPPGLMERLTATVLSSLYAVSKKSEDNGHMDLPSNEIATYEGRIHVKEVLCWRTAFFVKLGSQTTASDGSTRESIVEVFANLADRDSPLCVGSGHMGVGMRRLIVSGRGQVGDSGRKIWKGGYLLVLKCVQRVMDAYSGVEFEKQAFCPECLAKKPISQASYWDIQQIKTTLINSDGDAHCPHGHLVDAALVAGPWGAKSRQRKSRIMPEIAAVPVQNLLHGVVVVGLWNGETREIVRVGSGFIVDRKQGLIVTASHTLMNISTDNKFGENYYGLPHGKVVIGVIPRDNENDESASGREKAVFRYFAKIVAKDPKIDEGECNIDACVLRITTRMENDIAGNGEGCGDQPERLLLNNPVALKHEKLKALRITKKCELEEQVRIIGYNQGGEGLRAPGQQVSRDVDFLRGYVSKIWNPSGEEKNPSKTSRDRFKPRQEIVVISHSIGGHSGGPCVNQMGEVIGILSRADPPGNSPRCYICPTSEWEELVKIAKRTL